MLKIKEFKKLQEILMNSWPAHHYYFLNGWVLRFTEGVTSRANSVFPLNYTGTLNTVEKDINFVEKAYQTYNLPTIFTIPEYFEPNGLDVKLLEHGYHQAGCITHTMIASIQELKNENINDILTLYLNELEEEKEYEERFRRFLTFSRDFSFLTHFLSSINYIGPLRDEPHRYYQIFDKRKLIIGNKGEFTPQILILEKNIKIPPFKMLSVKEDKLIFGPYNNNLTLKQALSKWSKKLDLPDIDPQMVEQSLFKIMINLPKTGISVTLPDVGYGISHILPVYIESLRMDQFKMLILEQPEIHLHPSMQSKLADFLISMAASGKRFIVETHSEHLINRICLRIAQDLNDEINDIITIVFIDPPKEDQEGIIHGSTIKKVKIEDLEDYDLLDQDYINMDGFYAPDYVHLLSKKYLPFLLKTMKNIRLTPSSRGIVFALVKCGNLNAFKLVLDRIVAEKEKIDYWNHTELGYAAARQMEKVAKGIPRFLRDIERREEFWNYIQSSDRLARQKRDLLPIKCVDNRSLYIRLSAYGIIGTAQKKDQEILMRLVGHDYGLIARSAAIRLLRLLGQGAFWKLSTKVNESIQTGKSKSLADALRFAEIEFFGLARLW